MKKVVLLNSAFITKRKDMVQNTEPHLRIGMASIAASLLEENMDVIIIDPQLEKMTCEKLASRILQDNPDYLGLPAYTEEIYDANDIVTEVKKHKKDVIALVGGHQVTALPQETLEEFPSFDIGVMGEGETTIRRIVRGDALEEIPGIIYRNNEGTVIENPLRDDYESLDTLPFPAWHLLDLKRYYELMPIEPLRGCPYHCVFCFRSLGTKVRYKSPERILDELEHNIRTYGFKRYAFKCGTFPLSKSHAMDIFNGIKRRGIQITWVASTRVDVLDEELIQAMKDTGCEDVSLGIESGDPDILKSCGKNTTPEKAEEVLKQLKKVGIDSVEMNFILGLPGETRESLLRTKDFALRMAPYSSRVNFAILTAFPATDIYDMALREEGGFRLKTKDWRNFGKQAGMTLEHANFKEKELVKYQLRFYLAYYLRSPLKVIKLFSVDRFLGLLKKFFV